MYPIIAEISFKIIFKSKEEEEEEDINFLGNFAKAGNMLLSNIENANIKLKGLELNKIQDS